MPVVTKAVTSGGPQTGRTSCDRTAALQPRPERLRYDGRGHRAVRRARPCRGRHRRAGRVTSRPPFAHPPAVGRPRRGVLRRAAGSFPGPLPGRDRRSGSGRMADRPLGARRLQARRARLRQRRPGPADPRRRAAPRAPEPPPYAADPAGRPAAVGRPGGRRRRPHRHRERLHHPGFFFSGTALVTSSRSSWVTFVPCFLFIVLGAPYIEDRPVLRGSLDAVNGVETGQDPRGGGMR